MPGEDRDAALHLVFWSHSGELAGAELCLLELVEELRVRHGDVRLHLVAPWAGSLTERLAPWVPVSLLPARWWTHRTRPSPLKRVVVAMRIAGSVARAVLLLRRLRPDVVVTNSLVTPAGAIAARLVGIPHVWYVHEYGTEDHGFSFVFGARATLRAVERLSRVVVTNSDEVRTALFPDSRKVVVSAPGVNVPDDVVAQPTEQGRLLLLGQVREAKGHQEAIRALRVLRDGGRRCTLTIVGSGPAAYRRELDLLVRTLRLEEAVRFLPYADDPFALMQQHDVLLMCSRREALGRVVVEAMKVGLPVVASRSGASGHLVSGRRGWSYPPEDSRALAASIIEVLTRGSGDATTDRARTWACATFRSDRYADDLLTVVERVMR
jgi:glycosyltransferase involved in cell wall biosynthesis